MSKSISTVAGDTVDGLLYKHLGDYSNETEELFFKLNPNVAAHGPILPANITLTIPDPVTPKPAKRLSVWD